MEYNKTSPYANTPQTRFRLEVGIPSVTTDGTEVSVIIEAKYHRRPDLLSYEVYGTSRLWWIFAAVNPDTIKDPIFDFTSGKEIVLLSKSRASLYQ